MKQAKAIFFRAGCLVSLSGPLVGLVLYPRATWLFAFALVGILLVVGILVVGILTRKEPTAHEIASRAESLLNGSYGSHGEWDVEAYESLCPKDTRLNQLWHGTMAVGGPPEGWVRLEEVKKNEIQEIIKKLSLLGDSLH